VARFINDQGYRTRRYESRRGKKQGGNRFTASGIDQLLTNPMVLGKVRYKGQLFPGRHEPIIDEDVFLKVQALRAKNRVTRKNVTVQTAHDFVLEGLVVCARCGAMMTPHYAISRGRRYFYYRCARQIHEGKHACDVRAVAAPTLEKVVLDRIGYLSENTEQIEAILAVHSKKKRQETGPTEQRLALLKEELRKVVTEGNNLMSLFGGNATGDKTSFFQDRLVDLDERRKQLETSIFQVEFELRDLQAKVEEATAVLELLQNFRRQFELAPGSMKKNLMKYLLERVIYSPEEVTMHIYDDLAEIGIDIAKKLTGTGNSGGGTGEGSGHEKDLERPVTKRRTGRGDVLSSASVGSPGRTRTCNNPVNSRVLYH
jgi:site-specific DNA recombinase